MELPSFAGQRSYFPNKNSSVSDPTSVSIWEEHTSLKYPSGKDPIPKYMAQLENLKILPHMCQLEVLQLSPYIPRQEIPADPYAQPPWQIIES